MTVLASRHPGIANVHLDAVEHGDSLVFMHAVREGAASRSYGLQVARLAGVPRPVIEEAGTLLAQLQARSDRLLDEGPEPGRDQAAQMSLFSPPAPSPVVEAVRSLEPDALSPREALEALYRLHRLAREDGQDD